MRYTRHILKAALALVAFAGAAEAQNVQNFRPATGPWNYFSVESARVAPHGRFVPTLSINYGNQPLTERDADDKIVQTIVEHLVTADLQFNAGIGDRLDIGLDIPISYVVAGDANQFQDGAAFGDVRLVPKVRLFGLEKHDESGVGASISIPVDFPTGDKDLFFGADQVEVNPKLILEGRVIGFSFAVNGGFKFRPEKKSFETLELGNELTYGAAMGIDLGTPDALLFAEAFGVAPLDDLNVDSRSKPLEGLLGFRFFTKPGAVVTIGAGTGLIPDYGSPLWRGLLQISYFKKDRDTDGDGLLDSVDGCPEDPEDKDDFEDSDGCPDLDNDNDGILDTADRCPNDPEDKDGFEDEDGCPDPDNDKDQILDVDDKCPNDPETVNGYDDTDGCPDGIPDTDGDGLNDQVDKCPKEPEDKDDFQDQDGCPDPDNDNDGILDVNDKCPLVPETMNGIDDEDGCPDKKLTLVKVTKEKIIILQKVFFELDKDIIKPVSYPVLDEVAETMKAYTYIKKVEVQGHTDSQGKDDYNKDLSQRRADAVRKYIMDKGVEGERLTAVGFGEDEPIDTNKTKAGRANNRRVEFKILEQ
ncbi:MAG: OmpA family protein [bacterium]